MSALTQSQVQVNRVALMPFPLQVLSGHFPNVMLPHTHVPTLLLRLKLIAVLKTRALSFGGGRRRRFTTRTQFPRSVALSPSLSLSLPPPELLSELALGRVVSADDIRNHDMIQMVPSLVTFCV